jgi:hypothetical protein
MQTSAELTLVLMYISVLIIKACDGSALSAEALSGSESSRMTRAFCSAFGFGETADGVQFSLSRVTIFILEPCAFALSNFAPGVFLFFICLGLSTLILQLAFEIVAVGYTARNEKLLRRLRYRGGGFVELPPVRDKEFAHLPGLAPYPNFHLFLSRAQCATLLTRA